MRKGIAFIVKSREKVGPNIFVDQLVEKDSKYEVFYLWSKGVLEYNGNARNIWYLLKNYHRYRIVITSMFLPDLLGYMLRFLNIKQVIAFHSYVVEDLKYLYRPVRRIVYKKIWLFVMRRSTLFIASSIDQRNYYAQLLGSNIEKFVIIDYGIKHNDERSLLKLIDYNGRIVLGNIGSFSARKGQIDILEVVSRRSDLSAVLVGNGISKETYSSYVETNALTNRVKLVGFTDSYYNYYSSFDIYIQSSRSEGFGLTMLEAMSCGVPIILTDIPVYSELISMGFLSYTPGNVNELENSIDQVIQNQDYYIELSMSTYQRKFTLERMRNQYKNTLDNV